jgi:divalent metal cation (Fe/Co/Zn/Cd) transporter
MASRDANPSTSRIADFEFPPEQAALLARARRLAWLTVAYVASAALMLGLTMGGSQAMRTSFFEDMVSVVPALAFLVCTRVAIRRPTSTFPYGFHGVVALGHLAAALALLVMGGFLLWEAVVKLVTLDRTEIGRMQLFGRDIWAGWPMLAAVTYSAIPSFFLGRAKLKLAPQIHDKILHADAEMMRADWMVEIATGAGVIGVGLGVWLMDPLAAAAVSLNILKDGADNGRAALCDLIERRPMKVDREEPDPAPEDLQAWFERLDWTAEVHVRVREVGHVLFGEVFIRPREGAANLPRRAREARDEALRTRWRLHDLTVTVLDRLEPIRPNVELGAPADPGA